MVSQAHSDWSNRIEGVSSWVQFQTRCPQREFNPGLRLWGILVKNMSSLCVIHPGGCHWHWLIFADPIVLQTIHTGILFLQTSGSNLSFITFFFCAAMIQSIIVWDSVSQTRLLAIKDRSFRPDPTEWPDLVLTGDQINRGDQTDWGDHGDQTIYTVVIEEYGTSMWLHQLHCNYHFGNRWLWWEIAVRWHPWGTLNYNMMINDKKVGCDWWV